MSPLVDPCPRFSYRSESSITVTKPITRLQRAPQSDAPPPPVATPVPATPAPPPPSNDNNP
ncbi:hypothetical protein P691DRAFT_767222 [Macrolepiota fuliginosa MF-IS2]|uniref:Uncharacterized protein n=1 Tax=Macrolepiota fuliginosa MF-IS2 TaxID=1400762 RepID=A0A9P5WYR7_9AGAR|nr:hypothetical protein P691DRAFT_767222 [Macrolepiota fuliginosa MF-IS2]